MFVLTPSSRLVAAVLGLALLSGAVQAQEKAPAKEEAPEVDVVLCLDVSGSMSGLIDSAKVKLWDIVNDLSKVKPTPKLRVGLYSYGHTTYDAKKGWVRKETDLTSDLDGVYQKLNALTINGGTELVGRVTKAATEEQKWSENKKALRLIFVCGNEPATQDREVKLEDVAKLALGKDIYINTIYCGRGEAADAQGWKEYARLAEGRYISIDQNIGTVAIATPFDKEIETLSAKINSTYVAYGRDGRDKAENQKRQDENAAKLPGAGAARGITKGTAIYNNSAWDLVDRCKDDPKFDITKVPAEELPENMRKMTPEERVKFVKEKQQEREKIQKEITALSVKRADYIKQESKKQASKEQKALDEALRSTIKEQAEKKGIKIPE